MIRLILIAAFIAVLAIAITAMIRTMRVLADAPQGKDDDPMPANLQRVTYVLLIILMFGVATGWLGGT